MGSLILNIHYDNVPFTLHVKVTDLVKELILALFSLNGIEEIKSATFSVFTNLETVVIPKSIKKMDKDEFFKVKDKVTLYVQKGYYAEKFEKKIT